MPREHAAQSLGCLDEGVPAQVEDHPPQSSTERDGDAGTDAQEDSSPDPCLAESEVADPSWLPPQGDALLRGRPPRVLEGAPLKERTRRPPLNKGRRRAAPRALSLRSRTVEMGAWKQKNWEGRAPPNGGCTVLEPQGLRRRPKKELAVGTTKDDGHRATVPEEAEPLEQQLQAYGPSRVEEEAQSGTSSLQHRTYPASGARRGRWGTGRALRPCSCSGTQ